MVVEFFVLNFCRGERNRHYRFRLSLLIWRKREEEPEDLCLCKAERLKMGGDESGGESDSFDWNSEDEREIENFQSSSLRLTVPNGAVLTGSGEVHLIPRYLIIS